MLALNVHFTHRGENVKNISVCCDRCGAAILGGHSIIEVKAGELTTRHVEPLDLCADCCQRFEDWLRSGRQTAAFEPGVAAAPLAVPMCQIAR